MQTVDDRISMTLSLKRPVADRVAELAKQRNMSLEGELEILVENGLRSEMTYAERFDHLSDMYRARLEREGKLNQSFDETMEELARVREQTSTSRF